MVMYFVGQLPTNNLTRLIWLLDTESIANKQTLEIDCFK